MTRASSALLLLTCTCMSVLSDTQPPLTPSHAPVGLDGAQEVQQVGKIRGLIVPHAEVAPMRTEGVPRIGHEGRHLLQVCRVHFVVLRADGERFHLDLVQAIPTLPVFKVARDKEFALRTMRQNLPLALS